jgi:hypothetical protein
MRFTYDLANTFDITRVVDRKIPFVSYRMVVTARKVWAKWSPQASFTSRAMA